MSHGEARAHHGTPGALAATTIPRDDDGPVFEEPWQAEVFAITAALIDAGRLTRAQWSQALEARLADDTPAYYDAWLAALEDVVAAAGLVGSDDLTVRQQAWREAAAATPHGRPVELPSDR